MSVVNIPITKLHDGPNVRRVNGSDPAVQALAASMNNNGQEVEIQVYNDQDGGLSILFGHRRVAAARLLGWDSIRAIIVPKPESVADLVIDQYTENMERQGLSYLERANVYAILKENGMSQTEIAARCNVGNDAVSLALASLRLNSRLQDAINTGALAPSAVEALFTLSPEEQDAITDAVIAAKTVRKIKSLVSAWKRHNDAYDTQAEEQENDEVASLDELMGAFDFDTPLVDPLEDLGIVSLTQALKHLEDAIANKPKDPEKLARFNERLTTMYNKIALAYELAPEGV